MNKDEIIRRGVRLIKHKFLRWRNPPVELPADSVIEECVKQIYEDCKKNE